MDYRQGIVELLEQIECAAMEKFIYDVIRKLAVKWGYIR